jgi:lipopolysaccharide transport system permease protein
MIELLRGTWRFRGFILASVAREFASRYRGTQLGALWPLLHPLALISIYTLVFSQVMRAGLPGHDSPFAYSIYLTSGLVAWSLFSDLLMRSVGIFVHNAELLKKVPVHKLAFPAIAFLSALLQAGILMVLFLVFLAIVGRLPTAPLLAVLPVLVIAGVLAMGLGLFLATVNVFYRDVEQATGVAVQFWFWMTPIVYPISALPAPVARVIEWNPVWPIVRAMHAIFLEHRTPDWASLLYPLVLAIALAFLARAAFERLAAELVDEL